MKGLRQRRILSAGEVAVPRAVAGGGQEEVAYREQVLGQFVTPAHVVERMLALRRNFGRTLEPAAGVGAFLSCLEADAVGVEIDASLLLPDARVICGDFFDYPIANKFDTIIGNPPYVRFRDIREDTRRKLPSAWFDKRSNLYLFFIAKCMRHLNVGGELIFITPRDFLKATSARKLNEALYAQGSVTHWQELGDALIFAGAVPNCAIWRWEKGRRDRAMEGGGVFECVDGQICFVDAAQGGGRLGDFFDVRVGAVSGADDVFDNRRYGRVDMVGAKTARTGELRRVIYNERHASLLPHKARLMARKVRVFDESNWWQWGRGYCRRGGERVYVNAKTRDGKPFFASETEAYDGAVLALFARAGAGMSAGAAAERLNAMDWERLGFVCGGRLLFGQRSLASAPVGW